MMTDRERERYLASSTNMQHLVRLTLAVRAQLPKKYRTQLHALVQAAILRSSRRISSPSECGAAQPLAVSGRRSCPGSSTS